MVVRDLPPLTSPSSAGRFQASGAGGRIEALVRFQWSVGRESTVTKGLLIITVRWSLSNVKDFPAYRQLFRWKYFDQLVVD